MKNILIVDFSNYRNDIRKIYSEAGYGTVLCESAFEAMSKLKAYDFDLIVSEIELPGDNAFDLYNYINTNYPYIPTIMITDKDIDEFFERIFKEGIGNVLSKPLDREALLKLTDKLINKKNIFDLKNYLNGMTLLKKIKINRSAMIQRSIEKMLEEIKGWGIASENSLVLTLLLNEMIINAVYHSHGLTKEKMQRKPVVLEDGKFVDLFFGKTRTGFGISINDYNGNLTKEKILKSINGVIQQSQLLEKAAANGDDISELISETGRGIDLVRKLAADYYFIIKHNFRTEIILIFDPATSNEFKKSTSLKIIEDKSSGG